MARKRSTKPPAQRAGRADKALVDGAINLIKELPPTAATFGHGAREARAALEEGMKPFLDQLDALCERHLPEALVPSPCGQSRLGHVLHRPWANLLGCHDLCGRCREQALRALRLLREGVVNGKPSKEFIEPAVRAALVGAAARARELDQQRTERSMERMRELGRGLRARSQDRLAADAAARVADRKPLSDPACAAYKILCEQPETKGLSAKELRKELATRGIKVSDERIRGDIRNELLPYGLDNARGYYIPLSKRPSQRE